MIRIVPSRWQAAILVCGRCSRKVKGGFGPKGRTPLAKLLRKQEGFGRRRKADVGVVETPCLKLCPQHAVVAIDTRRPREWLLVRPGTDVATVIGALAVPEEERSAPRPKEPAADAEPDARSAVRGEHGD